MIMASKFTSDYDFCRDADTRESTMSSSKSDSSSSQISCPLIEKLEQENTELQLRLTELLEELSQVRGERKSEGRPHDCITKIRRKAAAESASRSADLQAENDALQRKLNAEHVEVCLSIAREERLNGRVLELELEVTELRQRLDDSGMTSRLKETGEQRELMCERAELVDERDCLRNKLSDANAEIDALKETVAKMRAILDDNEKDSALKTQELLTEEWIKFNELEAHCADLAAKLAAAKERSCVQATEDAEEMERLHRQRECWEQRARTAECDVKVYRSRLSDHKKIVSELTKERCLTRKLKANVEQLTEKLCLSLTGQEDQPCGSSSRQQRGNAQDASYESCHADVDSSAMEDDLCAGSPCGRNDSSEDPCALAPPSACPPRCPPPPSSRSNEAVQCQKQFADLLSRHQKFEAILMSADVLSKFVDESASCSSDRSDLDMPCPPPPKPKVSFRSCCK